NRLDADHRFDSDTTDLRASPRGRPQVCLRASICAREPLLWRTPVMLLLLQFWSARGVVHAGSVPQSRPVRGVVLGRQLIGQNALDLDLQGVVPLLRCGLHEGIER